MKARLIGGFTVSSRCFNRWCTGGGSWPFPRRERSPCHTNGSGTRPQSSGFRRCGPRLSQPLRDSSTEPAYHAQFLAAALESLEEGQVVTQLRL